jgi:hypothetical protein
MAITETKDKTTVPTHHQRPTWRCLITKDTFLTMKQNETASPASPIQRGIDRDYRLARNKTDIQPYAVLV